MTMFRFLMAKNESGFAVFCKGDGATADSGPIAAQRYEFSTGTITSATSMSKAYSSFGASNKTVGVFAGGFTNYSTFPILTSSQKYTWSNSSVATGGTLGTARAFHSGFSNLEVAIYSGGRPTISTISFTSDKYTFSNDSVSTGGSLSAAMAVMAGFSNGLSGYVVSGAIDDSTSGTRGTSSKYNFSSDTYASSTTATTRAKPRAVSNTNHAYIAGGYLTDYNYSTDTAEKWLFSSDTVSSASSLGTRRQDLTSANNHVIGLLAAGFTGYLSSPSTILSSVEVYKFSNEVRSSGTSLSNAQQRTASASSTPGHL